MRLKILGTGLTGLVGSRMVELLSDFEFENLSLEEGVDITSKNQVQKMVFNSGAKLILHLAAKTDVDACEKDRLLGQNGQAWLVNVEGTKNLVEAAKATSKKVIYISTDFVFEGTKDFYTEEDEPRPINWYGLTKYEAEKVVLSSGVTYLVCRLAFPFRAKFTKKTDFVRGTLGRLKKGQEIAMVYDQVITPTFIDDIAFALNLLINENASGTYHLVGSQSLTPYEAARLVAKTFKLNEDLISKTTRESYFAKRADRPFSLALKNDKLKRLGFKMSTFEEALREVKAQLKP